MRAAVILAVVLLVVGLGAGAIGCGGSDPVAPGPVLVVLKYANPCEPGRQVACACPDGAMGAQQCATDGSTWGTCEGCNGAGGSGAASSASATSGAGGEGGSTTSSTSSGSSSASSSSTGGACVPTLAACDPMVQCGDVDNGCGETLNCGGCEDGQGQPNPYLTCEAASHTCKCASAAWNTEAVALCQAEGSGGKPVFCGPKSPKAGEGCNYGGQTTTGEIVGCCAP